MSDLITLLNQNRELVPVTRMVTLYDVKIGSIPKVIPIFWEDGRIFAGGEVVLGERLNALRSGNDEQIQAWGNYDYDLADACLTFEDLLKVQHDSPFLRGIRGVVETSDCLYVAVDAEAVSEATKNNMKYFEVRDLETVNYGFENNKVSKQVKDVVLFSYVEPNYVNFSSDQFESVDAVKLKRDDFTYGRNMKKEEITARGKVVHPVYGALWPAEWFIPLVEEIFKFNKEKYNHDTNMGLYLTEKPQGHAEMRAFYASRLNCWSRLCGSGYVGDGGSRLVGVVKNSAAGKK